MPLLIALAGIFLLLFLILGLKLNAFISLIITSLTVGLAAGMQVKEVLFAIQKGAGDTLGSLALMLGFSAMLGKLVADSGAAQKISTVLIESFGQEKIRWAMILTGFMVGLPMFYTAAFVVLIPLIFSVAISSRVSPLYVGIPTAAALSVMHGFLPPHPGPSALAVIFNANIGLTMLYGTAIGIPAMVFSGIILSNFFKKETVNVPKAFEYKALAPDQLPSIASSISAALMPAILVGLSSLAFIFLKEYPSLKAFFSFTGDPVISLLISVLYALVTLGLAKGMDMKNIGTLFSDSIAGVALILLIIAGGGAFKQILVDSKTADYIAGILKGTSLSPLFMGWLIAACIRVALGSATVAALTTAGIVLPLISASIVSPELMVLAIGSGSLMFSHVNDTGFWLFKEYFNLSIRQTILSWSIMETIVSLIGLGGVLLIDFML
jgi:Gnt-I system high-affinity gluconate transporter